jgi:hypothetical protein
MSESRRIPYVLWPVAILYGFAIACTVNVIEKKWRPLRQKRRADWRRMAG